MKVRSLRWILLSMILLAGGVFAGDKVEWENVSHKEGITVQRVYSEDSTFLRFRGMGIIDAPVVRILALLQDQEKIKLWNKNSYDNKILQKFSDEEMIVYSVQKVPWPFKDRDFVMRVKFYLDEKNKTISIVGKEVSHPKAPVKDDRERMKLMRTKWFFKPLKKYKGQKTWVEFHMQGDPGGNIPAWLINFVSKFVPYKTLANVRREVKGDLDPEFIAKYKKFQNWY